MRERLVFQLFPWTFIFGNIRSYCYGKGMDGVGVWDEEKTGYCRF